MRVAAGGGSAINGVNFIRAHSSFFSFETIVNRDGPATSARFPAAASFAPRRPGQAAHPLQQCIQHAAQARQNPLRRQRSDRPQPHPRRKRTAHGHEQIHPQRFLPLHGQVPHHRPEHHRQMPQKMLLQQIRREGRAAPRRKRGAPQSKQAPAPEAYWPDWRRDWKAWHQSADPGQPGPAPAPPPPPYPKPRKQRESPRAKPAGPPEQIAPHPPQTEPSLVATPPRFRRNGRIRPRETPSRRSAKQASFAVCAAEHRVHHMPIH